MCAFSQQKPMDLVSAQIGGGGWGVGQLLRSGGFQLPGLGIPPRLVQWFFDGLWAQGRLGSYSLELVKFKMRFSWLG